jgi:hypothetical protein
MNIKEVSGLFTPRLVGGALPLALVLLGCGGSQQAGAATPGGGITKRDTTIRHEECDIKSGSAEKIDANNDRRPDVYIVRSGGREVCRAVDLNFDGTIDSYAYYDEGGRLRRREYDYDRDGRIDEIAIYRAGVISEKSQATLMAQRLDTWAFYKNGVLSRSERDSNGDGVIDQWWEYSRPECPTIHADVNNDGRPDPGATVDYCKETGYVPPERQGPRAPESPDFQRPSSAPVELENKPGEAEKKEPSEQ